MGLVLQVTSIQAVEKTWSRKEQEISEKSKSLDISPQKMSHNSLRIYKKMSFALNAQTYPPQEQYKDAIKLFFSYWAATRMWVGLTNFVLGIFFSLKSGGLCWS